MDFGVYHNRNGIIQKQETIMFTRNCPECKEEILYKYKSTRDKAETNQARCPSCRNQKRDIKTNCRCKTCGKDLYRRKSRLEKSKYIFCTTGCRNKFYTKEKFPELFTRLKRDRSSDQKRIRYKKEKAVEYKGGKCELCGYDRCIAAMDFHHINPEDKLYEVKTLLNRRWDLIVEEIKKCMLLCSNCHRELHWNERRKKMGNNNK